MFHSAYNLQVEETFQISTLHKIQIFQRKTRKKKFIKAINEKG